MLSVIAIILKKILREKKWKLSISKKKKVTLLMSHKNHDNVECIISEFPPTIFHILIS